MLMWTRFMALSPTLQTALGSDTPIRRRRANGDGLAGHIEGVMTGPPPWETMWSMTSDVIEIRAAVCRGFGAPLAIETLRLAPPEGSEIRVRVRASSICHSDITYMDGGWGGEDTLPAVFGHELAGGGDRPRPLGAAGRHSCVGDRVLVSLLRSCGRCERCEAGSPAQCTTANSHRFGPAPEPTSGAGRCGPGSGSAASPRASSWMSRRR